MHVIYNRQQELAHLHDPSIHGGAADVEAGVTLEDDALAIERKRGAVLGHDRVDDDLVRDQRLRDDALGGRRNHDALLLAPLARALLALGDEHEVLGRCDVQLFALFVADQRRGLPAAAAGALRGRAGNDLFHAVEMRRKALATGMLARRLASALISRRRGWRGERSALALRLNLLAADARLQLEQLQLEIAELLAVLAVLGDERKTKTLFQNLYLQLRILKLARGRLHLPGLGVELLCSRVELLLQLRNERGNDGIGVRRYSRLRRRTHDASLIADRPPACKRNVQ